MAHFNRLHLRIMLPFLGVVVVVGVVSLFLSRHTLDRLMDQRMARQSQRISQVLSNAQFVFNPVYLEKLRGAIDSDIVVLGDDDVVRATTLTDAAIARLLTLLGPSTSFDRIRLSHEKMVQQAVRLDGRPTLVTARILPDPGGSAHDLMLWVLTDLTDASRLLSAFTIRLLIVGLGGMVIVLLIGYLVARSISRPVDELVAVTGEIAHGRFERQALLPGMLELRVLAGAINTMSRKLKAYREQEARNSRLAAAGKITAAVAHEIKNPLASVKMLVQLLRNQPASDPASQKIVCSVLEEITRLERIVEGISITLRPADIKKIPADLNLLIDNLLVVVRPKMTHRKIELKTDLMDGLPRLAIDIDKIKQVLWNLLLNAMDSMPGGGSISVRTRITSESTIRIVIEDEGIGIGEASQEQLFAPFFTTKPQGLGVGLSTSRDIVAAHDGSLTLVNRSAGGARATIELPVNLKAIADNGENTDC